MFTLSITRISGSTDCLTSDRAEFLLVGLPKTRYQEVLKIWGYKTWGQFLKRYSIGSMVR